MPGIATAPVEDCGSQRGTTPTGRAAGKLEAMLSEIPEADCVHETLGTLALRCGCSTRQLRRLVRLRLGMGFREWMAERRMDRARRLLEDTREKILVVALESGYRHTGLFHALFKQRHGMTPSEWRRTRAGGVRSTGGCG